MSDQDFDELQWRRIVEYVKNFVAEHGDSSWDDIPPPPPEPPPPPPED